MGSQGLLATLSVALLFLSVAEGASRSDYANFRVPTLYERNEPSPSPAQRTCLEGADPDLLLDPLPGCSWVNLPYSNPGRGVLVLQSVYRGPGLSNPWGDLESTEDLLQSGSPTALLGTPPLVRDLQGGGNFEELSGGLLPDVIVPGPARFLSFHGWWSDEDQDTEIRIWIETTSFRPDPSLPGNEWVPRKETLLVGYIDPGSHPPFDSLVRPSPATPDFTYSFDSSFQAYATGGSTGYIVFLDGSIFTPYTVTTVADAILSPSPDGTYPFTATPQSLVDVDSYAGVFPEPLAGIFRGVLGPVFESLGSPSVGYCKEPCEGNPLPVGGTPIDRIAGPIEGSLFGAVEDERVPENHSTNPYFLDRYPWEFRPWVDLRGRNLGGGASVGSVEQRSTFASGPVSFDLWVGLFKDLNRDGWIGNVKNETDPYESGSRPDPNDYGDSQGEFIGISRGSLVVTLTPDTVWGEGVVFQGPCCVDFSSWHPTGSETITLTLFPDSNSPGHFESSKTPLLLFLFGSPGFTACTQEFEVSYELQGVSYTDRVHDCDHFPAWV